MWIPNTTQTMTINSCRNFGGMARDMCTILDACIDHYVTELQDKDYEIEVLNQQMNDKGC
jgi:hypothetical protein